MFLRPVILIFMILTWQLIKEIRNDVKSLKTKELIGKLENNE